MTLVNHVFCLFIFLITTSCGANKVSHSNSSQSDSDSQHVVLISLDGFRWDYVERFKPPHLSAFVSQGARAESLVPCYPSKTFPNHYSIATGMYPDHHGLIGNTFYNVEKDATYQIRDRDKVRDGDYYGGKPIWNLAQESGMITASFFFVGTEALIDGRQPNYYRYYNGRVPNEERIDQAIKWLEYSDELRPQFIALYFSDMDDTGHRYGPQADEELETALMKLDKELGVLFDAIKASDHSINVILVSDHGMKGIDKENFIPIEKISNTPQYRTMNNGVIANIHPLDNNDIDTIFHSLSALDGNFKVYYTQDVPFFDVEPINENWGPIQVVADSGYYFHDLRRIGLSQSSGRSVFGHHGFDPQDKDMHGIFYMNGPSFKSGYVHPSVKNIHVYPLICEILGLEVPDDVDGELQYVRELLIEN